MTSISRVPSPSAFYFVYPNAHWKARTAGLWPCRQRQDLSIASKPGCTPCGKRGLVCTLIRHPNACSNSYSRPQSVLHIAQSRCASGRRLSSSMLTPIHGQIRSIQAPRLADAVTLELAVVWPVGVQRRLTVHQLQASDHHLLAKILVICCMLL